MDKTSPSPKTWRADLTAGAHPAFVLHSVNLFQAAFYSRPFLLQQFVFPHFIHLFLPRTFSPGLRRNFSWIAHPILLWYIHAYRYLRIRTFLVPLLF